MVILHYAGLENDYFQCFFSYNLFCKNKVLTCLSTNLCVYKLNILGSWKSESAVFSYYYDKLCWDYTLMTNCNTLNVLITVKLKQKLACCCFHLLKIGITSFVIGVWRQINSYLSIAVYFLLILPAQWIPHTACAPPRSLIALLWNSHGIKGTGKIFTV